MPLRSAAGNDGPDPGRRKGAAGKIEDKEEECNPE